MKMFFLLKNNARRGMGGKGVLKKGEEKEAEKGRGKRSAQKGPEKGLQNSRILKRMAVGRKFANFEGWGTLFKNFRTIPRRSHNVNKSE